jgi:putative Mg2+ transporter-C (MgtC) family protein
MVAVLSYLRELNIFSMMFRIVMAMVVGGLIGFDREKKGRPAGFRTYMLVAVGATLTVILSQYLDIMLNGRWLATAEAIGIKTDVSRFGAQVINGVGFLGAGTIIVTGRQEVKGLTTAAALWASACMGLAIGAGFYECMIIGTLLIIGSMKLLPVVENYITDRTRHMSIYVGMESVEDVGRLVGYMKQKEIKIYDVEVEKAENENLSHVNALFDVFLPKQTQHTELLAKLATVDGIIAIEEV